MNDIITTLVLRINSYLKSGEFLIRYNKILNGMMTPKSGGSYL
jgi:hypothetical protein